MVECEHKLLLLSDMLLHLEMVPLDFDYLLSHQLLINHEARERSQFVRIPSDIITLLSCCGELVR